MSVGRENLHRLIEQLPESELHAAQRFLEFLRDIAQVPKTFDDTSGEKPERTSGL